MPKPKLNRRLSSLDSTFLYLEKEEAPLHIGSTSIFEGRITRNSLKRHINERIHLLPRYQQRVVPDEFGIAHPTWEFAESFDIDQHIFEIKTGKDFTTKRLMELMGKLMTPLMDRGKPLWELHVVTNLEGGRSAMIAKIHHAMIDGVSGVDLMKLLFDISPKIRAPNPIEKKISEANDGYENEVDSAQKFLDSLVGSLEEGMNRFIEMQGGLLYLASSLVKPENSDEYSQIAEMLPSITTPAQRLPFNGECSGKREIAWSNFSFTNARKIKNVFGATVNDVVLTVLSDAVSRYSSEKGYKIDGKIVRFMMPVSMRRKEQRGSLGNQISILPVEIPLQFDSLRDRINYVNRRTNAMKQTKLAAGLLTIGAAYALLPAPLQSSIGGAADLPFPPFNMVATNVPGPQIPLYLMGKKLEAQYPYVPIGYGIGLGCAIFSYNKELYFGLSSDAKAMSDVNRFKEILDNCLIDLSESASVKSTTSEKTK